MAGNQSANESITIQARAFGKNMKKHEKNMKHGRNGVRSIGSLTSTPLTCMLCTRLLAFRPVDDRRKSKHVLGTPNESPALVANLPPVPTKANLRGPPPPSVGSCQYEYAPHTINPMHARQVGR